ncbi:MAG: hypothetical protein JWO97_2582 [Acidobacteria bacterium]|nr:hypothetical protein [Acidobacteriota bacterium]
MPAIHEKSFTPMSPSQSNDFAGGGGVTTGGGGGGGGSYATGCGSGSMNTGSSTMIAAAIGIGSGSTIGIGKGSGIGSGCGCGGSSVAPRDFANSVRKSLSRLPRYSSVRCCRSCSASSDAMRFLACIATANAITTKTSNSASKHPEAMDEYFHNKRKGPPKRALTSCDDELR